MPAPESLTLSQARRVALAAQGLARTGAPGRGEPGIRQATEVARRLGVIQIDSVNVLARAHLMPLYSRLGPYHTDLLGRMSGQRPRRLTEAWAHEASFIPVETWPLLAWRRGSGRGDWLADHAQLTPEIIEEVLELLRLHGPCTAAELDRQHDTQHPKADYWSTRWSAAKAACEVMFADGRVCVAGRSVTFERVYDVTERVLPPAVLATPIPSEADAIRALLEIAARAHGVATERDLKDYFRLGGRGGGGEHLAPALRALLEDGTLRPVEIKGLHPGTQGLGTPRPGGQRAEQWYLHRDATVPRQAKRRTLLAPFDPLVFERTRLEQLFGIEHRLEIYTPAAKRRWGYYVYLFLDGEQIAARVDLKADRQAGLLRVPALHLEPSARQAEGGPDGVLTRLTAELRQLAGWLGLAYHPELPAPQWDA